MIKSKYSIDEILNEFKNKVKFSDFLGQFIQLNRKGNSFVGKCPFHDEKTPSFNVNDDKGLFYCFGCKEGGNVINFLSKYKNYSFKESVSYIANYIGLSINDFSKTQDKGFLKQLEIANICTNFFEKCLWENKDTLKYLSKRVSSKSVIKDFKIGYCPNDQMLINFLKSSGIEEADIWNSDLFIKNSKNEYFGRFRGRLVFPIFNFNNQVVGFGGRTLNNSKIKYINSQENRIFKKSEILFGFEQNKDVIRKSNKIVLVEGYLDVISLYQKNIKIATAPLGTTLSQKQIIKMWSLSNTPYICFDGDNAGKSSSIKVAEKIIEHLVPGKSLKFMTLPENTDPDSFMRNNSIEDFYLLMEKSLDLSDVIWDIIINSIDGFTPEFFAALDDIIKEYTSRIKDSRVSSEYFKFLINKKKQFVWEKRKVSVNNRIQNKKSEIKTNLNPLIFIGFLIFEENILENYYEEISKVILPSKTYENYRKNILESFSENDGDISIIKSKFSKTFESFYDEIIETRKVHFEDLEKDEKLILFEQILKNLKLPELKKELDQLKERMIEYKDNLPSELIKRYEELNSEIKKIKSKEIR